MTQFDGTLDLQRVSIITRQKERDSHRFSISLKCPSRRACLFGITESSILRGTLISRRKYSLRSIFAHVEHNSSGLVAMLLLQIEADE